VRTGLKFVARTALTHNSGYCSLIDDVDDKKGEGRITAMSG
jgi:hypothetical protein